MRKIFPSFLLLILIASLLFASGPPQWNHSLSGAAQGARQETLPAKVEAGVGPCGTLYASEALHLWNRLYCALFVRKAGNGTVWGYDALDPLVWANSKFLLEGESHRKAIAVLDEFISSHGERLIRDRLKRALLQRDLLQLFSAITTPLDSRDKTKRAALQTRLAILVRRLALAPNEMIALPSNFQSAVESRRYPAAFNPKRPTDPFLPPNLFDPKGPWNILNASNNEITPRHIEDFNGRSIFFIYMNHPQGKKALQEYLATLAAHGDEPDPPQFPVETQFALVRKAVLVDSEGQLYVAPLVESVQTRVYRNLDKDPRTSQLLNEFFLSREKLLRGETGGLTPVDQEQEGFPNLVLQSMGFDPIESAGNERVKTEKLLKGCFDCHSSIGRNGGIETVNIYRAAKFNGFRITVEDDPKRPADLGLAKLESRYHWGVLKTLLNSIEANQ